MKIDTLSFIQNLLRFNQPASVFYPHTPVLVPIVMNAVADPFYKISSEALVVLETLVKVLRPLDGTPIGEFGQYVNQVSVLSKIFY